MELPIIDAGGFESAGWHKSLDDACRNWGCFQIINHTLSGELMARTREEGRAFFDLPREEKLAIERTRENAWGFFDKELTKNVRDWKEIFDVGPTAAAGPMAGSVPQWPVGLPGFRSVMEAFYEAAERVSQQILSAISCNLGMAPDHLAAGFASDQTSFLRLNFYPPCADPEAHLGISPHTDAGALTVLLTDEQPGLQFRQGDDWHTVRTVPGALVINIGDIVQVWSNDRYTAPLHRVLANAEQPRFSAPFFYNPSYALDYAPLPGVVTDSSPARYRSINWGAFRAGRAAGDYADYGEEIQISQFRI